MFIVCIQGLNGRKLVIQTVNEDMLEVLQDCLVYELSMKPLDTRAWGYEYSGLMRLYIFLKKFMAGHRISYYIGNGFRHTLRFWRFFELYIVFQ